MRTLVWFAIGFTAACAVGAYLLSGIWLLLLALFCLVGIVGIRLFFWNKGKYLARVLLGLSAAFVWMWIFDSVYLDTAREYHGRTIQTSVELSDYSQRTNRGYVTDGIIFLDGRPYQIRLYSYGETPMAPGDTLQGQVELQFTQGENWSDYYSSAGVHLIGYTERDCTITHAEKIPLKFFAADLRHDLLNLLEQTFPEDVLGFAQALLIGEDRLLDYETNTHLSISGIRHVVAVSGQHVAILFSLIYAIVGYRRFVTPFVGLPILLLFAALTGFTPSVNRACMMQALMMLAMLFDKEYDPPTALSFAVLVMLVANPMCVASVSFQLSTACVIGIQLFYNRIYHYLMDEKRLGRSKGKTVRARLCRMVSSCVSMSLSTMVTTTPLCAVYFGTISLVSILTNLLTLWAVGFLFYGIMVVCAAAVVYLPIAKGIAAMLSWLIRYILLVSKGLSKIPLAAVYTQSIYIVFWLVFCYVILLLFLRNPKKKPLLLLFCVLAGLSLAIGASWLEPRLDHYRMTVLDVGQGQCILVQKDEKTYVIDCGGNYPEGTADLAAQTLLSQGITQVDGLILTHYDDDHAGSVAYFLSRMDVKTLYLPNIQDAGTIQSTLIRNDFHRITWIHSNSSMILEDGMLQLFVGDREKDEKESGLCILCRLDNCDILITGDRSIRGEGALMEQVELPDLDVLIAGHHGSLHSTGRPLLKATKPEVAVISAGRYNSYGHPSQDLLERLKLFECQILCTADNGTITIRG